MCLLCCLTCLAVFPMPQEAGARLMIGNCCSIPFESSTFQKVQAVLRPLHCILVVQSGRFSLRTVIGSASSVHTKAWHSRPGISKFASRNPQVPQGAANRRVKLANCCIWLRRCKLWQPRHSTVKLRRSLNHWKFSWL